MLNIKCDKCNGDMILSDQKTFEEYARELGYKVLEGAEIDIGTIQDYTVFTCGQCRKIKKYSFKELEFQLRRSIAYEALKYRMVMNNKILKDKEIDFDSKMFYCGKCVGIDAEARDGYCLKSISKFCRIYKGLKT